MAPWCLMGRRRISRGSASVSDLTRPRTSHDRWTPNGDVAGRLRNLTSTPRDTPTPETVESLGGWLARSVFAAKFAGATFVLQWDWLQQQILFNRDPAASGGGRAVTDSRRRCVSAIVNKRLVWIVDGPPRGQLPVLQLALSSATADSNEVAFSQLVPDRVSYIRNSAKVLWIPTTGDESRWRQQDRKDPVLKAWMQVFPGW